MSLAPPRISIKRRREDAAPDSFHVEARKRRVTDFIYQRVRDDHVVALPTKSSAAAVTSAPSKRRASVDTNGIPQIRATTPGEELSDYAKLRAVQKPQEKRSEAESKAGLSESSNDRSRISAAPAAMPSEATLASEARRFHLAHDLSALSRVHGSGRISKRTNRFKPPLPTFIEAMEKAIAKGNDSMQIREPIDRIVQKPGATHLDAPIDETDTPASTVSDTVPTFLKPDSSAEKVGKSINDDPSTWDITSDHLADQLAALAMEIDSGSDHNMPKVQEVPPVPEPATATPDTHTPDDDDFVYETYVKIDTKTSDHGGDAILVDVDVNVGVLVIDEEDEELWEEYMQSDDEEDWDEEDSNAEENPANDYPEDEVDSDDEFDEGAYNYRQGGSDDEQWDENDDYS